MKSRGFRKGRGCVDQIFAVKMLVEEYLGKDKKLYAAFMDLLWIFPILIVILSTG